MPDWTDMSQDALNKAFSALPLPLKGPPPPGCSIYEAIQASIFNIAIQCYTPYVHIVYNIIPDIIPDIGL
jgi:hypothetical protein